MRPLLRIIVMLIAAALLSGVVAMAADAQRRPPHPPPPPRPPAHHVVIRGEVFIGGYFYDPVWGPYPWWPRPVYPRYYPVYDNRAEVRLEVKPRETAVYVDGFYAGIVDEFDGLFQRLPVSPGSHDFTLYLAGYRTARYALYLGPGASFDLHHQMLMLPPGLASEPPPYAVPIPPPPPGSYRQPRSAPPAAVPQIAPPGPQAAGFGTLDVRVQPSSAQLTIDGQPWLTSEAGHFVVQLPAGSHHVEVAQAGYRRFAIDLAVGDGETEPLNVSLMPGAP